MTSNGMNIINVLTAQKVKTKIVYEILQINSAASLAKECFVEFKCCA